MAAKLVIEPEHIREFLKISGCSVTDLSELLNVNVVTVRRWLSAESPPTSAAFLMLLPLLLASGVKVIPEPDQASWNAHISALKRIPGFNVDPTRLGEIKQRFAYGMSAEYNASLKLFLALAKAWSRVDPDIVAELAKLTQTK